MGAVSFGGKRYGIASVFFLNYPFISMVSVKLQKETPTWMKLSITSGITVLIFLALYFGIPGTGFNGVQSGVYFDMESGVEDAYFMDNKIKCTSEEAESVVRAALSTLRKDYPTDRVSVKIENYSSGYRYQVRFVTYYAQRFSLFGEGPIFQRGIQVGDPQLDAQVKKLDDEIEKTIRDSLEYYFRSKGAK